MKPESWFGWLAAWLAKHSSGVPRRVCIDFGVLEFVGLVNSHQSSVISH
jgi:hypothetical protein